MRRIITLTTDFGLADTFVGAMKGVILSVAPDAAMVDLTHEIPAQDIIAGALALESAVDFFPRGTIHVAVVDPGVGTTRRPIAISTERAIYIGPDNGLFTLALRKTPLRQLVRLSNTSYFRQPVSATFHGRDIFASVAAHLVAGVPYHALGERIESLVELEVREPMEQGDEILLRLLTIDRFGNLITNLRRERFEAWADDRERLRIETGGMEIRGIHATFGDVESGEPVAYFGSGGRLEIAIRDGSAAAVVGARRGDSIVLRR
jgi:S-adenosylmethionine hydrolase